MTGTVLVMTDHQDHTADLVVAALYDIGADVVRLDPGSGPISMDVHLDTGRWRGLVGDEHRAARLEHIVGVLWRWPTAPIGDPTITDPAARAWAAREDTLAMYGVLRTLPAQWVNHPGRADAANHKPHQLITAQASGLLVPDTIITNHGDTARTWATGRPVIYKAFHCQGADADVMVAATGVDPDDLPAALGAASTFQQIIEGPSIRLTAVGRRLFAVQITGDHGLDWRPDQDRLGVEPVEIPPGIAGGVRSYMDAYRLEYGAFDFIAHPDGWVFLECNPTGMYGFVELGTGLPISAAIATHLCRAADASIA